jgi:hypothetical protein
MGRKREKLARVTSDLRAPCMDDAMSELTELMGSSGWKKGSKTKTIGREGRARGCSWLFTSSCDDGRARLRHTTVYGIREARRSESG